MEILREMLPELGQAWLETLMMLAIGLPLCAIFGISLGVCLFLWNRGRLLENIALYRLVGGTVNILRSFPFVILMIGVLPLSRLLTGTTFGPVAASVPLTIAGMVYYARLVELSLSDVPRGVIEAAQAMGASVRDIIFKVLLVEARSGLVLGFTSLSVSYLSYSAAAGMIGGGGIGDLAIRRGYQQFETEVMLLTVLGLILFVQLLQAIGNFISRKIDKR